MGEIGHQHALEAHLRAQVALGEACGPQAVPFSDAPPGSGMGVDCFLQILHAAALTGAAFARLVNARPEFLVLLPEELSLPRLPEPPQGGTPPPPKNPKTTSAGFSNNISRLGSSPAQRGRWLA
jgi:hypothetical protein